MDAIVPTRAKMEADVFANSPGSRRVWERFRLVRERMSSMAVVPGTNDRQLIRVSNFDPVPQARVWRALGPEIATNDMVAMLRTALLLGEELVIDRNDLLDGVFFLTLGPEGVAQALGLNSADKLPLTILAQPGTVPWPDDAKSIPPATVELRKGEERVSFGLQLQVARSDHYLSASSALGAMWDGDDTIGVAWMYPDPCDAWYPGAGFTDRFHPCVSRGHALAMLVSAQDAWYEAAVHDRITVRPWTEWDGERGTDALRQGLKKQRDLVRRTSNQDASPVVEWVLRQHRSTVRKAFVKDLAELAVDGRPRSEGAAAVPDWERRLAVELWSRGYNHFIAVKENAVSLTFSTELHLKSGAGVPEDEVEKRLAQYGLSQPTTSRWSPSVGRGAKGGPLRVQGQLVDHMRTIGSHQFRELASKHVNVVGRLRDGDRSRMYDLVLAAQTAVEEPPSYRRHVVLAGARAIAISLAITILTVLSVVDVEAVNPPWVRGVLVVAVPVLSLLSALPWDDLFEFVKLRPESMAVMLNLESQESEEPGISRTVIPV